MLTCKMVRPGWQIDITEEFTYVNIKFKTLLE